MLRVGVGRSHHQLLLEGEMKIVPVEDIVHLLREGKKVGVNLLKEKLKEIGDGQALLDLVGGMTGAAGFVKILGEGKTKIVILIAEKEIRTVILIVGKETRIAILTVERETGTLIAISTIETETRTVIVTLIVERETGTRITILTVETEIQIVTPIAETETGIEVQTDTETLTVEIKVVTEIGWDGGMLKEIKVIDVSHLFVENKRNVDSGEGTTLLHQERKNVEVILMRRRKDGKQ